LAARDHGQCTPLGGPPTSVKHPKMPDEALVECRSGHPYRHPGVRGDHAKPKHPGIGAKSAGARSAMQSVPSPAPADLGGHPGGPGRLRRSGQGHLGLASVACLRCHRPTGQLEHELPVRRGIAFVGTFDGIDELARVEVGVPARSILRCCRHAQTLPRPWSHAEDAASAQNEPSWRSSSVSGPCRW